MSGEELSLVPGQRLVIIESTAERLIVESFYEPGGTPPPPHLHPAQDEFFEVLSGTLRAVVANLPLELAAGDELEIPRETVHQMWNGGSEPAHLRWTTVPAGRTEGWFRGLDALRRRADAQPQEFIALLESFDDVIRMVPPA